MLRIANRKDANQTPIVEALRDVGVQVYDLQMPLDLLTGYRGVLRLIEIKDGAKSESRRKLRPKQKKFMDEWIGYPIFKVETVEQALRIHGISVD